MSRYPFAILAALCFSVTPALARFGSAHGVPAIAGTTFGILWAVPFLYVIVRLRGRRLTYRTWSRSTLLYVCGAGVSGSLGILFYWMALSRVPISIAVAINSSSPLLTILLSYFLLRQDERITLRLVSGAVLVICGVLVITI